MTTASIHGMWSTRLAFILAASGSAVGLGNMWRFPDMADVTANALLPLGGILMAVFAVWRFLIRWVAPLAVSLVLLNGLGLFKALGLG